MVTIPLWKLYRYIATYSKTVPYIYQYIHCVNNMHSSSLSSLITYCHDYWATYVIPLCKDRKQGKIHWAKFSRFSRFSGVPRKFFREYKCIQFFSLIVLNNEHLWPRQRESISVKTSMALKLQIFSPVNLSPSTIVNTFYPSLN